MFRQSILISLLLLLLSCLTAPTLIFSQSSETILTIAVPDWMGDVFTPDLFSDFEAVHPGVKVVTVKVGGDSIYFTPAAYDLEGHLNSAEAYTRSADVLYVTNYILSLEAAHAGFFLDLAPLVAGDPSFNASDFFPAVWQSFQWDHSVWAIPLGANVIVLVYDIDAFDAAGLAYPNPSWTVDELLNAARKLTQKNAEGQIVLPGLMPYDTVSLLRSLLGENFYDANVLPNQPDLIKPELISLLETWHTWEQELNNSVEGGYRLDVAVPMMIEQPYRLYSYSSSGEEKWAASLLPGNRAGLSVTGFGVSAGTFYPELAYELACYVTQHLTVVTRFNNDFPARRSVVGVESDQTYYIMPEAPPEVQPLLDEALANALPVSDLRYANYVQIALSKMNDPTKLYDAETALEEAQTEARSALAVAEKRRGTPSNLISTPIPTSVLSPDETALTFGLTIWSSSLPNQGAWDEIVTDFIADDPEIGQLIINTNVGSPNDQADINDCFFLPYNRLAATNADPKLLNLDPFMSADPNFDPNDVLPGALAQLQYDNKTWGYPLVIMPDVLWYEPELFEQAGVMLPTEGWTIETFNETLYMLKMASENDRIPFVPSYGSTYMLMLIAAYGGLPFDYRTDPPTLNLTNSATIDAIRQTLDLVKAGLIDYQPLDNSSGSSSGSWEPGMIPLTTASLVPGSERLQYRPQNTDELPSVQIVLYPYGSQYTPVSYQVGAAYISVNAPNPEACYRWISVLAQHAELFMTMPAFQSQINSPTLAATQGKDIVTFYRQYAAALQDPNLVLVPSSGSGTISSWIEQIWFNRALDHYVLEDGDLQADLAAAEIMINSFRECAISIPAFPIEYSNLEAWEVYYQQITDCAIKIDPDLAERFALEE